MNEDLSDDAVQKLNELLSGGNGLEQDHIEADRILCDLLAELGYAEVVEKYYKIDRLYS